MANISHWGMKDGFRLAQTVGKELRDPSRYSTEEFIQAAEKALERHPKEWVIYYSLGDKYQEIGYYAEALKAVQKCVELRPKDMRSTYALATTYNILTRTTWSEKEEEASKILQQFVNSLDKFDKKYSQAGLDHTGLIVDTAAVQAIRWFEASLNLKPDAVSKRQINQDLAVLYNRFPHLER